LFLDNYLWFAYLSLKGPLFRPMYVAGSFLQLLGILLCSPDSFLSVDNFLFLCSCSFFWRFCFVASVSLKFCYCGHLWSVLCLACSCS